MSIERIREILADLSNEIEQTFAPAASVRYVNASDNLQEALDQGGNIEVMAGVFEGTFKVKSNTSLKSTFGAALLGKTGPALVIPPSTSNVTIDGFFVDSNAGEVLTVGNNDQTQTAVQQQPSNIILRNLTIKNSKGRRAIAIHAREVKIDNVIVENLWDNAGQDSQAIYIGNAFGNIHIHHCKLSAGSEILLVGGDEVKTPGLVPTNILIEYNELSRPLSWMTDGIARKVKNILELKSGMDVIIRYNKLHGSWKDGQQGECFVLTPTLDGTPSNKKSGIVKNVHIHDNEVYDIANGFNLLGKSYNSITSEPLSRIFIESNTFKISKAKFGGGEFRSGQLFLIGNAPADIHFNENYVLCDGENTIYLYEGDIKDSSGTLVKAGKMGQLELKNNKIGILKDYGFNLGGRINALHWGENILSLIVTGNKFGGANTMKNIFPNNEWLDTAQFALLPEE